MREVHVEELAPPAATFRWALEPMMCDRDELRSSVDSCAIQDMLAEQQFVAVYAPIEDRDPRIAVIRYDGGHIGAPLRWQKTLDFGDAPHSAVVTIVLDTVIVAAISNGAARVAAIDSPTGRMIGTATLVERAARAVQLDSANEVPRIHVRTANGGVVGIMNPRSARVIATRVIEERSILEEALAATPVDDIDAQIGDMSIGWENRRLVLRRDKVWMRYLRAIDSESEKLLHRTSMERTDDRVLVTLFNTAQSKIEVLAFAHATGEPLWRSAITGGTRHGFTGLDVRAHVEDDQLVIAGRANTEHFVCTIGVADGIERACVDRAAKEPVFDFGDDPIVEP